MADDTEVKGVTQKSEQELTKHYKRQFENWREILVQLHSLLKWEKPYHPGILAGLITLLFIMLWYCEPSILTTLAVFGIIACVMDYLVPILSSNFFDSNKWTGVQEHKYEEICKAIVGVHQEVHSACDYARQMKENKPKLYFLVVLAILIVAAWIGNLIDNLFLTYITTLFLTLLPGIKAHNVIQQHLAHIMQIVKGFTSDKKKK